MAQVKQSKGPKCIFCGQPGTEVKLLNARAIPLCLEDYQTKTSGEVVEQDRKRGSVLNAQ